jgi:hypothetical protein
MELCLFRERTGTLLSLAPFGHTAEGTTGNVGILVKLKNANATRDIGSLSEGAYRDKLVSRRASDIRRDALPAAPSGEAPACSGARHPA